MELGKGMSSDFLSFNPAQQILIVNGVNFTDLPDLVIFIHQALSERRLRSQRESTEREKTFPSMQTAPPQRSQDIYVSGATV